MKQRIGIFENEMDRFTKIRKGSNQVCLTIIHQNKWV